MELKKIRLEDKELFQKYSYHKGVTSQFTGFVNLFIWRNSEQIEYFIRNEKLFVTGKGGHNRYFMFPNAQSIKREDILFLMDEFKENWKIMGLSKEDAHHLENECGDIFSFSHIRDMDNYVYLSEKLINLSGRKYHSKKNHINSFKKKYNYTYVEYSQEKRKEVMSFLGKWYIEKDGEPSLMNEANSIVSAIDNYKYLGLKGAMIMVEDEIVAFTMGEKMTDNMAVIHFEKANTDFQGSYAVINNEFVKNAFSDVMYINREEDMGIEGLRNAKLSYKPEILVEIYSGERINL